MPGGILNRSLGLFGVNASPKTIILKDKQPAIMFHCGPSSGVSTRKSDVSRWLTFKPPTCDTHMHKHFQGASQKGLLRRQRHKLETWGMKMGSHSPLALRHTLQGV